MSADNSHDSFEEDTVPEKDNSSQGEEQKKESFGQEELSKNVSIPNRKSDKNKSPKKKETIIQEAELHFPLYIGSWVIYHCFGTALPLYLLMVYLAKVFIPIFLLSIAPTEGWTFWFFFSNPVQSFSNFAIQLHDPTFLLVYLTSPLVFMGLYLLKMFLYAFAMKFFYWLLNVVQPRRELINALPRGNTKRDVDYYHWRNFMLRIVKWEYTKSPFPWLTNWMYNFVGCNKIGKGTVLEDGYVCQEYLETGENVYCGFGTVTTSHLVEGIYGALILKKIVLDNDSCIGSRCAIPPGTEFGKNSELLWYSGVIKYQKVKPNVTYWGLPASRLTKNKYQRFIKLPEEFKKKKQDEEES